MCSVSNTYRIGKVRIEYVSIRLMTVLSQPYYIPNMKALGLVVSDKKIFENFILKSYFLTQ